jgi:hypothetical protein
MPDFSQLDHEVRAAFRLDFDDVVARGVRRRARTRRRVAAVACGLAVLVAGGGAVVAAGARNVDRQAGVLTPTPSTPAPAPTMPDLSKLKPLAEEFPHAVRRLPERLPDGSTYTIVRALGGDKYLVHGKKALWVFDAPARQALRLMDEPATRAAALRVSVSGEWVLRVAQAANGSDDIIAVRLSGGAPVRVASSESVRDLLPVVVNGDVVWASGAQSMALWRAPLTGGGPVTAVPGGDGWLVHGSVWAVTAVRTKTRTEDLPIPMVWNLETGERRGFTLHPDAKKAEGCSADWCLVRANTGNWAVQRRDGSGYAETTKIAGNLHLVPQAGRFVNGFVVLPDKMGEGGSYPGWRGVIWDVESGRAGIVGGTIDSDGFWEPSAVTGAVPLDNDSYTNRTHAIIDLTAL